MLRSKITLSVISISSCFVETPLRSTISSTRRAKPGRKIYILETLMEIRSEGYVCSHFFKS